MGDSSLAPALELLDIDKSFGGVRALQGAELVARRGEILGLCGENGAGKSTLLKILGGVHPRSSYGGTVRVHGEERSFASTRDAERAGIAVVHQELMLVAELTVAQNLALGHEPTGPLGLLDDEAMEVRARDLLAKFGVERDIDASAPVSSLGIGLMQVVEIVRALSHDARILVLDEPTAALTSQEADRLTVWLRDLREAGTTCLYVSHRIDEVFALCDRVTVLRDGRTVGTVDVKDTTPDAIVEMMVGRSMAGKEKRAAPFIEADASCAPALEVRELCVPLSSALGREVHEAGEAGEAGVRPLAVDGVSFALRAGEVLGVCGAMGSGRTALLSTLFGCAARGYTGAVRIDGGEVKLGSPRAAMERGLALVPEDRKGLGLVLDMSVADNLTLTEARRGPGLAALLGFVDEEAEELLARRRVEELGIRGAPEAAVLTLSGGNQQKVVLGKWLESPPRVLLLDEPTRGVDVGAREEIYALLERLTKQGVAVLIASSDLPEILRLAHRVLVLRRGRIVAELDGRAATEAEIVSLATGVAGATGATGATGVAGAS
jgi:D-xylose transport system ATP-binding protein